MSVGLILIIALVVFLLFLAAEMPVAVGLLAGSTTGLLLYSGFDQTASYLGAVASQATSSYALVVIPMFVLMGALMAHAGVLTNLFDLAARVTRRIPGGLGVATVLSASGFSAVTGSSAAAVTTLGRLCVGEMVKHGYSARFGASVVAAAGTLGVLIPPSIVLVIYGVLTSESVGKLLLASLIPGLLTALAYASTVVIISLREKRRTPVAVAAGEGSVDLVEEPVATQAEQVAAPVKGIRWSELEAIAYILLLAGIILGGIYGGLMTETEAGAVGALVALVILLVRSRRTEHGLRASLADALKETATNTSMLMALLICGSVFTFFLVVTRVPQDLTAWIVELDTSKYLVLAVILIAFLILGALLDGMSILLLTIPLTYPLMTGLGFDGLWYGIIAVKMIEIGLLTPPFGLNVYMVAGVVKTVRVESVFRGVVPFIVADLAVVGLLVAFPELVTWLPSLSN
jgi:C4-dicarboxylate transporter DctM subunit